MSTSADGRSKSSRRRWFYPRADNAHRTGERYWGRNRVDRGQRERRAVIIIQGRLVFGVMLQDPVGLQVAVDDRVNMPLFLGFVHVLGRRDGKQSRRDGQNAGDKHRGLHGPMVSDCRTRHQAGDPAHSAELCPRA